MRYAVSVLILATCLGAPATAFAQEATGDPWEGLNRNLFAFHETVDKAVIEPVARGYRAITPRPVRTGVQNFLRNLRGPVVFANDVLQGEFSRAGVTAARFGVNTTIGVAGVLDPATSMGLERHDEDFGQTLAVWGVDSGPYIFIPLLGPSTVRDAFGRVVDRGLDPITYAEGEDADEFRIAQTVFTALSAREQLLDPIADVRANSVDPYASFRASYLQLRESAIQNGRTDIQDLPDFDETPVTPDDIEPAQDGGPQANLLSTSASLDTPELEQSVGETP